MNSETRPATDSPWFWVCMFATAALVALAAIGPKYTLRQAQIEREFQGRQRAAQNVQGQAPSGQLSTPQQTLITLRPLFYAFAALISIAWFLFWQHQYHSKRSSRPTSDL
jgi:hypothetical protein